MTTIHVSVLNPVIRVTQVDGTQVRVTSNNPSVRVSSLGLQGPPGPRLVEIIYQISGTCPPSRTFTGYLASANITFIPTDAIAIAGTANSVDTSITIMDLSSTVLGSIVFLAGATTGTVTISATTLSKNNGLRFVHPSSISTLADLIVTLPANRGA